MAQDDGQERTEEPTSKRLSDARQKGQIPRSREFTTMMVLLAAGFGLYMTGGHLMEEIEDMFVTSLTIERQAIFDTNHMLNHFKDLLYDSIIMLIPYIIIVMIAAIYASIALGGWAFSIEAMQPKLEKLDPIKGIGRLFGWKTLVELIKAVAKAVLIGGVAVLILWNTFDQFLGLSDEPLKQGVAHMLSLVSWGFILVALSLLVIAAIDVPFQLWDHKRQLKMTLQEVKDEHKETDGNPELKGKIRQAQMEAANRRMMQDVPKADVIITNPTHYSVALVYEQDDMSAPRVVASGVDMIAQNIRTVANEYNIPTVEAPPLARALYYSTEVGDEIPAGLYMSVAKILAYIYQIQVYEKSGGFRPSPLGDEDLPIPDDLRRDS